MRSVKTLKMRITKIETRVKAIDDNCSVQELQDLLQGLKENFDALELSFEGEDSDEAMMELERYEQKYFDSKSILLRALEKKCPKEAADVSVETLLRTQNSLLEQLKAPERNNDEVRLPKVDIPKFSGDYAMWSTFRDMFEGMVDGNTKISSIQKHHYLKTLLSGEALGLLKHIPLTAENYETAWAQIKARYDRPYLLVRSIIQNFLSAEGVNSRVSNIRQTYNHFNETIKVLSNMGDYASSIDPWLIHFMVNKLDSESIKLWSTECADKSEPKIEDFLQFMDSRCNAVEISSSENKHVKPVRSFTTLSQSCFFCSENHSIHKCEKFKKLSLADREKTIKTQFRCFKCLKKGHNLKACKSNYNCQVCKSNHHTLLHKPAENNSDESQVVQVNVQRSASSSNILPTALVNVRDGSGSYVSCRVLLDTGAQASFITEKLFKKLNLKRNQSRIPVKGLSLMCSTYSKGKTEILIQAKSDSKKELWVTTHILPELTGELPSHELQIKGLKDITSFELADPSFHIPSDVDILLGAGVFFEILGRSKFYHLTEKLWIQETMFGFVICGGKQEESLSEISSNINLINESSEPLDQMIEKLWDIEDINDNIISNEDNKRCEEIFKSTLQRTETGRFIVGLPFVSGRRELGDSYEMALRRFLSLERKFANDVEYHLRYVSFMQDYLKSGHMEEIPKNELCRSYTDKYYLPHHGVQKQGASGIKLRVVFDASAKSSNGVSLNDLLLAGPNLQQCLTDVIANFRFHKFVFTSDIQQMYRQIEIRSQDQDFQRILWRESKDDPIIQYRLKTVTYGTTSAPFLAIRALRELAIDKQEAYPRAAEILKRSTYMDDIIAGSDDITSLINLKGELVELLGLGQFCLKKWASNSDELLKDIKLEDQVNTLVFDSGDSCLIKTLGVQWSPKDDQFTFKINLVDITQPTRRALLSETAKLYDPFGWVSPVTVTLKIVFQETWVTKTGWDQSIPENLMKTWFKVRSQLLELEKLKIPRWIVRGVQYEIHGFADASEKAYAAVLYLRSINIDGTSSTYLIAAKTKLSPIKSVSIARLELCAAHLLAKLVSSYYEVFTCLSPKYVLWSDSTIVLAWLSSPPRKWKAFVANRTSHILTLCRGVRWRHVKSSDNPADIASRGILPRDLINNELWWNGPSWVCNWIEDELVKTYESTQELKVSKICAVSFLDYFWPQFLERFSSFKRVRKIIAYWLRYFHNKNTKNEKSLGPFSSQELQRSSNFIIRKTQALEFGNEVQALSNNKLIDRKSKILKFNPYLDANKILRIGGRLQNSMLSEQRKHPIILPKGKLSELLIDYTHITNYHGSRKLIINLIRTQYWILGLQASVKRYIKNCKTCVRYNAKTYQPSLGPLPKFRVEPSKPFETTGLDFAGPVTLRAYRGRGNLNVKGYIAVFICLATKAMHLELVMSLSTESLLMSLKRFLARRGRCSEIWSDNGRNFAGCNQQLIKTYKEIAGSVESDEIKAFVADNMIAWRFIPPYSPNFGGIWESGVKSVKSHLRKTFSDTVLSIEEYSTALCQIEALLNSRPLLPITDDPEAGILTPGHFLINGPLVDIPLINQSQGKVDLNQRYQFVQTLVNGFWKKWKSEYLCLLNVKNKWYKNGITPSVDDIVLVKRASDRPALWPKGRIIRLYPGSDNVTRVVDVQTTTGIHCEAIRNLVPFMLNQNASTGGACLNSN